MYDIKVRPSGYILTFSGAIDAPEMRQWVRESKKSLAHVAKPFGVIVDMRDLAPLDSEAQATMVEGQALYKEAGMNRSAVILASPTLALQFRRLAKQSGIDAWERYIDASTTPNWQSVAVLWVKNGRDPDAPSTSQPLEGSDVAVSSW